MEKIIEMGKTYPTEQRIAFLEWVVMALWEKTEKSTKRGRPPKQKPLIEKEEKEVEEKENTQLKFGENVTLSQKEYDQLKEEFWETRTNEKIEKMDLYMKTTGKQYKSHFVTLQGRLRKEATRFVDNLIPNWLTQEQLGKLRQEIASRKEKNLRISKEIIDNMVLRIKNGK